MDKEKGAITITIFFAMLLFSIYGIIFYGNSASAYLRQSRSIKAIQDTYSGDIENAYQIAENLGI